MPPRLAIPIVLAVAAAALLAGCGGSSTSGSTSGGGGGSASSSSASEGAPAGASARACVLDVGGIEGLRAAGVSCGTAQGLATAWRRSAGCEPAAGASRSACTVRSYRCLATSTARGYTVGCSRPGRSVAFIVRKR